MRNYCVMQSIVSLCRDERREAILVSPPLMMIASAIDQALAVPPRWYQPSTGVVKSQAKHCKGSRIRKTLISNWDRCGSPSFFKQTHLGEE